VCAPVRMMSFPLLSACVIAPVGNETTRRAQGTLQARARRNCAICDLRNKSVTRDARLGLEDTDLWMLPFSMVNLFKVEDKDKRLAMLSQFQNCHVTDDEIMTFASDKF
jgi:hypothetical protein